MQPVSASAMHELIRSFRSYLTSERMLAGSTVARYVGVLADFTQFLASEHGERPIPLEAVGKDELSRFLRREVGDGEDAEPSRAVFNARLAALRSFYDYLFKREVINVNPALRVDRLKIQQRERLPLSFEEVLALVDAVREHSPGAYRSRNVGIVQVFFHCSIRVAELVSLHLDQVDFDNRAFLGVRVKGDKRLSVLFNDIVAEALEQYLGDRQKLGVPAEEQALFVSQRRERLSIRAVQELVKRYGKLAGISRVVTPHVLRHSSATELADIAPLRVVQEHCGHAQVTTTERYVHVKAQERRRAVDELGNRWRREARARRRASRDTEDAHPPEA